MRKFILLRPVLICLFSHFLISGFTQNVGINTTIPAGKLHVKGSDNISQLVIDADTIQSNVNPLIKLRKSTGADLMWIHSDDSTNIFIGKNSGSLNNAAGSGKYNIAVGYSALQSNYTGSANVANGYNSLKANTTGFSNTATGYNSLSSNTIGFDNTANGQSALSKNTTAGYNTAIGSYALYWQSYNPGNYWYSNNVAVGRNALHYNQPSSVSNGINNTAVGTGTLFGYEIGFNNTAVGCSAMNGSSVLAANTGYNNTAIGVYSLFDNSSGSLNNAIGYEALLENASGNHNTALGCSALRNNLTGSSNTGIGTNALYHIEGGEFNIAIGASSGTGGGYPNLNNTVSIGNHGYSNLSSNQAFIGNLSTNWIGGQTTWFTYASDARVKKNVNEDVKGLEFISKLRPVTYYLDIDEMSVITGNKETEDYPEKYDVEKIKQSGFIAQEVEKAAHEAGYNYSGITIPKASTELYTLSYEQFVVPLVKAVQELNEKLILENEMLTKRLEKLEALMGVYTTNQSLSTEITSRHE